MDADDSLPWAKAKGVVQEVLQERIRQVTAEGWTAEHDDQHHDDQLARAAACYLLYDPALCAPEAPPEWPWYATWWKPKGRRRDLIRAAALLVAEIERLDRLEP